jgi:hypothetical protein
MRGVTGRGIIMNEVVTLKILSMPVPGQPLEMSKTRSNILLKE